MDSAAPTVGKSRGSRRWRLVVIFLLALPMLALVSGNLILATPWACRRVAAKIQRHAGGLDARISGMTFTPWGGIFIKNLELLQPIPLRTTSKQPLLHIDSLQVAPVWQAWLRGRVEVQSMELDTPRIVMPVELLAHLTQAGSALPPQVASAAAAFPPVTPSAVTPAVVTPPVTIPDHADPPLSTTPPPLPPLPPLPPPLPTGWLHLKNASFTLIHAGSKQVLLEISNTHGDIPISGNPAKSRLTIGSIFALGQPVVSALSTALDWKSPQLSLCPVEVNIGGYPFFIAAQVGSFNGLPLQIEAKLPAHKLAPLAIPFGGQIEAESIAATARFRGLLLGPATWQGDLVVESTSPAFHVAGQKAKFDRGTAITILRGGIFSCVDARLIGDELSLLGNATLLADGRLAGAARIVATPETVMSIARQVFPKLEEAPLLTPLSTPQRAAFDLEASGTVSQLFLRLGKGGPTVEFKP